MLPHFVRSVGSQGDDVRAGPGPCWSVLAGDDTDAPFPPASPQGPTLVSPGWARHLGRVCWWPPAVSAGGGIVKRVALLHLLRLLYKFRSFCEMPGFGHCVKRMGRTPILGSPTAVRPAAFASARRFLRRLRCRLPVAAVQPRTVMPGFAPVLSSDTSCFVKCLKILVIL